MSVCMSVLCNQLSEKSIADDMMWQGDDNDQEIVFEEQINQSKLLLILLRIGTDSGHVDDHSFDWLKQFGQRWLKYIGKDI